MNKTTIVANIMAQERLIAFLLANYVEKMSPKQRATISAAMSEPAKTGLPHGLNLNIDDADRLAGMAIAHKDAVNRMFSLAATLADSRAQTRSEGR
jgi:hypothetical protein